MHSFEDHHSAGGARELAAALVLECDSLVERAVKQALAAGECQSQALHIDKTAPQGGRSRRVPIGPIS
jgi:hypothetical protein